MEVEKIDILMVEDNPIDALRLETILAHSDIAGFEILHAITLRDAECALRSCSFDVMLLDLSLSDSELESVKLIRATAPELPIVVLTSSDYPNTGLRVMMAGAEDYLVKGQIDARLLARSIRYAIERNRVKTKIQSFFVRDPLTRLYNRRGFFELARRHLRLARRKRRAPLLILADLDCLNSANARAGHRVDNARRAAAEILRRTFRPSDPIARIGEDAFAVLVIDASIEDGAEMVASLEQSISNYNEQSEEPHSLSLSISMVSFDPALACSIEELIERAGRELSEQKRKRRCRVQTSEPWSAEQQLSAVELF